MSFPIFMCRTDIACNSEFEKHVANFEHWIPNIRRKCVQHSSSKFVLLLLGLKVLHLWAVSNPD